MSNNKKESNNSAFLPVFLIVQITLIACKLFGFLTLSWAYVFVPIYAYLALWALLFLIMGVVVCITMIIAIIKAIDKSGGGKHDR